MEYFNYATSAALLIGGAIGLWKMEGKKKWWGVGAIALAAFFLIFNVG